MDMMTIDRFTGQFDFLSNFYPSTVEYMGLEFPTAEHAFQARKCWPLDKDHVEAIRKASTPSKAKMLGRRATLDPQWEEIKVSVMAEIVYLKFTQNPELGTRLMQTDFAQLIEGNTWGDRFWGCTDDPYSRGTYWDGKNVLGTILMTVRAAIQLDNLHSANKQYSEDSML
jgi:ribA/ribD-fused uncharacterized protein